MRELFRRLWRRKGSRILAVVGIAVLGIAIGYGVDRLSAPDPVVSDPAVVDVTAPVPGFGGRSAVAVLPFTNQGGGQAYFADGVAEDILMGLRAWRRFPVIARESSFGYRDRNRGRALDAIGKALGVGYVVEGAVERSGDQVWITAQVADTHTGERLWAGRYHRRLLDLFDIEDQILMNIVNTIAPGEGRSEMPGGSRGSPVRTGRIQAYDDLLRARALRRAGTFEDDRAARELLLKALELDPQYGPAYVTLAWIEHGVLTGYRNRVTATRAEQARRRALDYAKTAVELDPAFGAARGVYAHMLRHSGDLKLALTQAREAVRLDPSDATVRLEWGAILCGAKKYDRALAAITAAKRLSPLDPDMGRFLTWENCALLGLARFDEAIRVARRSEELRPNRPLAYVQEIVALIKVGRAGAAQERLNRLRARFPDVTVEALRRSADGEEVTVEGAADALAALDWEAGEED